MSKGVYIGGTRAAVAGATFSYANFSQFFTTSTTTSYQWNIRDNSTNVKLVPSNIGVNSSTATTTFTAVRDMTGVIITGAYYTESGYDKITLTVAGTTVLSAVSGSSAAAQRWSGTLKAGNQITFTYSKDISTHANQESLTYFTLVCDNIPSIPSTSNIAKKVKKMFVGVSSKAHKVKKGYIGVNGVAKLFFLGAASNVSLHTSFNLPSAISGENSNPSGAASVNDTYFIFAGGYDDSAEDYTDYAAAYNQSFTQVTCPTLNRITGYKMGNTSTTNYAIFAGGYGGDYGLHNIVTAYNSSLTRSTPTVLTSSIFKPGSAVFNEYSFILGGAVSWGGSPTANIDIYSPSLVKTTQTLSKARHSLAAAANEKYIMAFGGRGADNSEYYNTTNCYDITHTSINIESLSAARAGHAAIGIGDYILTGGGFKKITTSSDFEYYDSNLTRFNHPYTLPTRETNTAPQAVGLTINNLGIIMIAYTPTDDQDYCLMINDSLTFSEKSFTVDYVSGAFIHHFIPFGEYAIKNVNFAGEVRAYKIS